ncbi:MAG: carboxypeptidase regulatory-like domain-containing protein, partial [Abitibacteriaceae bacterium]|nr:carboxypeptidase regulatory-like domain-containing protein [Abditibacteriaceae bacterium]
MKQFSNGVVALLLAVIFCVGLLQPLQAQPLPDRRTLTGRITRNDGTPIGGASITLRRQDETATAQFWGAYAVSDARGQFTLPDIEEGAYYVDVDADGYAPDRSHDFTLDKSSPPLQIKLAQLVPLILRILKPDGTALANTTVMMRVAGEDGAGTRLPRTNTNESGLVAFTLSNSEMPNCPLCRVVPSHYAINVIAPGVGYAVVKDLNVQLEEHPKPIDIHLQVGGTIHITAREEAGNGNAPGKPIGGALVSMMQNVEDDAANRQAGVLKIPEDTARFYTLQRDPSGSSLITRDGDGVVEFGDLPPGNYQVRVFSPILEAPEPQNVQIKTGAVANVEFGFKPLPSAGTVAVEVHDAKDQLVANTDFVMQLQPLAGRGG